MNNNPIQHWINTNDREYKTVIIDTTAHLILRELSTTLTLENAIDALASIGFRSKPFNGNKIPAAIGMPIILYINAQKRF